ncbi:hypothetical protein NQ314_011691 [Rhamnusium bicolor]|uniref:Uncharacterized protein n=1 Tax=Rhamnusium bicolor TaxID=1586634 RepID=A0AAV8XGE2_9CUCU|nr:hypothetical protein NQ314_011691 [Rhamnusium bicolor]
MSTAKKGQSTSHYEHTSHVSARRRSLFPADIIESDEDSDLGHISPLIFDSDHEDLKCLVSTQASRSNNGYLSSKTDSIGDYDIIGVVENMQGPVCTPITKKNYSCLETMSPLYLSPYCTRLKSTENTIINETPFKMSPSYNLKTPHDAPNTNSKVPKLVRKSLLDTLENTSIKRKLSSLSSPEQNKSKHLKLDPKNSKVRTTLFPEVDISLPAKSFYPRTENIMENLPKRETFPKSLVLCNRSRKTKSRKKIGEINAGVGHKIRKPKQKRVKALFVKAALNVVNNSALTEYIKDLKQLNATNNEQVKLIENKENAKPKLVQQNQNVTPKLIDNNEENNICPNKTNAIEVSSNKKRLRSPVTEPDPNKKFFKFSRARGVVTMNKNIKLQVDHGKMTLLEKRRQKEKRGS